MFVSSFFACLRRFQEKIHPQTSPSIFSAVLGPPYVYYGTATTALTAVGGGPGHFGQSYTKYYPLHKSSLGIVRLHRALGAGWGGVGETGWKWDIRVKIDCHMKPYADKLFVVLYFSVRSSRSSAHGRHFANIPWGRELGFYSARWMRKARKMETCRGAL